MCSGFSIPTNDPGIYGDQRLIPKDVNCVLTITFWDACDYCKQKELNALFINTTTIWSFQLCREVAKHREI